MINAEIAAGLGIELGIVSGYVKEGIEGIIGVDLVDGGELFGTDDGKIRASEIIPRLSRPWTLFEVMGVVNVFLSAEVNVVPFGTVYDKHFLHVSTCFL